MALRTGIIGSNSSASVVPGWNDYEFQQLERNFLSEGVIQGIGGAFAVTQKSGGANMSVDIASGRALIEITNTNLAHGQTYKVYFDSDATENRAVATADTTNPRKDRVILRVSVAVNPDGSSGNVGTIEVLTGTPAGSPSAPAEPANAITLAIIDIPASDTSIEDSQITDSRPYVTINSSVLLDLARKATVDSDIDALRKDSPTWLGTITGTDTLTGTIPAPAPGAYAAGMRFAFILANTNTGPVTINLSSLGAKDLKAPDGSALSAGMLKQSGIAEIRYDGTQFLLTSMMHNAIIQQLAALYLALADSSNNDTGTWTSFDQTYDIAANSLAQGDVIDIWTYQYNNGGTREMRLRLDATVVFTESSIGGEGLFHVQLVVRSAPGASCTLGWVKEYVKNGSSPTTAAGTATVDTTQALTIDWQAQQTAGSENTHILKHFRVTRTKSP